MFSYLKYENLIYDMVKEFLTAVLFIAIAYRILADVPVEGPLDQCLRYVMLALGYALIPGLAIKAYVLIRDWNKA